MLGINFTAAMHEMISKFHGKTFEKLDLINSRNADITAE